MKKDEKEKAIELRKQGLSINKIAKELKISKGTASAWLKNIKLSEEQIKKLRWRDATCMLSQRRTKQTKSLLRLQLGEEEWKVYQSKKRADNARRYATKNPTKYVNYKREVKRRLIEYKGGCCEICGYNKNCLTAYHFHHRNPKEKEFSIAARSVCFETAKSEVDKCMLLCSNCHSEIHDKEYQESKSSTINKWQCLSR